MLETSRLILRPWEAKDKASFAALNADPDVMRFFPAPLQRTESDNLAARFQEGITERGWGFWAVELKETHQFVGCVGLHPQPDKFHFSPCTQIVGTSQKVEISAVITSMLLPLGMLK